MSGLVLKLITKQNSFIEIFLHAEKFTFFGVQLHDF